MNDLAKTRLMAMVGVGRWEDVPSDLVRRCERIEASIQKAKPEGALVSSQVLALIVEQWDGEQLCFL